MIYFLSTRGNGHPIRFYLESYGRPLAGRLVPMWYDELLSAAHPPVGTYCFADLELLSDAERAQAVRVWDALAARRCRLLNHPVRSLRRYDLLRTLHAQGINRFAAYRVTDAAVPQRFPVFLRGEQFHNGARTPLLDTPAALEAAVAAMRAAGESLDDKLMLEFCDTADARGIYRKYSAFIVGDRILARHVFFAGQWHVKDWDLVGGDYAREERTYLDRNPHERRLREIFALAGITYGRIDYSLLGDAVQVWEINTNPILVGMKRDPSLAVDPPVMRGWRRAALGLPGVSAVRGILARRRSGRGRPRAEIHARFAARLQRAWEALDRTSRSPAPR